jgi:hypothetical protein
LDEVIEDVGYQYIYPGLMCGPYELLAIGDVFIETRADEFDETLETLISEKIDDHPTRFDMRHMYDTAKNKVFLHWAETIRIMYDRNPELSDEEQEMMDKN